MTDSYSQYATHYVSVDCIVFGLHEEGMKLLLIKRNFEPARGQWSLMGGFVDKSESIDDAARRVLRDLTGLDGLYMQPIGVFGEVDREPGTRVISIAYCSVVNIEDANPALLAEHNASWVPVDNLPDLCFDHKEMVDKGIYEIRRNISTQPLVFRLLPELFTLTKLQQVFEQVTGQETDKRNFRRRILENSCVVETDKIDKHSSRRGARLYRFDASDQKRLMHFKI